MARPDEAMIIAVAIATFERGAVVVRTIDHLLQLDPSPSEIVIADQTRHHPDDVEKRLAAWNEQGVIRWLRLPEPSIPRAMNQALLAASAPLVLFIDDDVEPSRRLLRAHLEVQRDPATWAVAGQILEPEEEPAHHPAPDDPLDFRFNHDSGCFLSTAMAGNLSVKRERALQIGGFDENFVGAAYRFETDFALRIVGAGGRVRFEPSATVRHLKVAYGGIRAHGDHRATASPAHAVGDYYFALRHRPSFWRYAARRLRKNIVTRYHARHPWTIPSKLIGEIRGIVMAWQLARRPPRLIGGNS